MWVAYVGEGRSAATPETQPHGSLSGFGERRNCAKAFRQCPDFEKVENQTTLMPVIKFIDPGEPEPGSGRGSDLAAAVMAVTLSSDPANSAAKWPKRGKPEKTRRGNPNHLTRKQHVFPLKMMEQFAESGHVSVYFLARGEVRPAKPDNPLFCARRAWDQRTESGYMKRIEDEFQSIVAPIINGTVSEVTAEQKAAVDRMYALWYRRARSRDLEEQEI